METQGEPMMGETRGDMPGGAMDRPGGGLADTIERNVALFVDRVVAGALEQVSSRQERNLVRESLAGELRQVLTDLANREATREMALAGGNGAGAMAMGEAVGTAMGAARQVQELGFVQFTAGLITGTFDAIIGATVKQMDAYAKLVADLAKTLAQFQAENVSDAQINEHLAQRYPDGQGGTVVRPTYTFTDSPADATTGAPAKSGNAKLQEVVEALIVETMNLRPPAVPLTREATSLNIPATDATINKFTADHVGKIRTALGQLLATTMLEHLRAMAREGMARIVIRNGEILSRLTFNVTATERDTRRASDYHRDSAGAYIRGSAWAPWGTASAGANWNQLNVRTVNETSFDAVTMSAEIIGQVKLNFATETFPPIATGGNA